MGGLAESSDGGVLLRVCELFSGIGGWHAALDLVSRQRQELQFAVVLALDNNQEVNQVYAHNFPDTKVRQGNAELFTAAEMQSLNADMWLMSPPCQPYTRQPGTRRGHTDARAQSLFHIIRVLSRLPAAAQPSFLLLENVQGFEMSDARDELCLVLRQSGYHLHEFLLSPMHFGIPNFRTRYFLTARKAAGGGNCIQGPLSFIPGREEHWCGGIRPLAEFLQRDLPPMAPLGGDGSNMGLYRQLLVSDDMKRKAWPYIDVVVPSSIYSNCFTKSYGRYAERAGSCLLVEPTAQQLHRQFCLPQLVCSREARQPVEHVDAEPSANCWVDGRRPRKELRDYLDPSTSVLRYFSPREMLNLMGFPPWFSFPADGSLSVRQQIGMIGNAVNVRLVAELLHLVLSDRHMSD
ncbi:unnamed protein product [Vitrella brassicaformis CCMP3155]|uniref:tRNA (cytosine(38)-C(5))-methyltransferase n=2 Tax=Vitrella brassicaformis TaxID=1169539 RepID=A0A0G4H196_VITBC|nr:unnamed protein product [Vitrella brassicaformis CCMP3155]|eukprot:CEM37192.1 unnamed protein product [Vitrella brassicaformis CCMP3155]